MSGRARRLVFSVVTSVVVVAGIARPGSAFALQHASAPFSWNPGKSLATAGGRLVSVWASDCPPPSGACSTDRSPSMGVFVQRSPVGAVPAAWGRPMRVSPRGVQAERPSIAANPNLAVVGWVTQSSYLHYDPAARRSFWIRVSTDHGATWRTPHRVSLAGGRVDYPRLAVEGREILAVWTNANTGAIRFATTTNLGGTWTNRVVGTTSSTSDGWREGFAGLPDIGVSGMNVAVVWFADPKGAQQVALSSTGGTDLTTATARTTIVTSSPNDGQRYAGAAGSTIPGDPRVAVAFTIQGKLMVRVWDGVTLGPAQAVASFPTAVGGVMYAGGYGPAVLPTGSDGLVVAFAACRRRSNVADPCDPTDIAARIDVLSRGSPDGGATWGPFVRLADASKAPYRINDEPSIALTTGIRRIAFDSYQPSFVDYVVRMHSGM
ncbi:MAG: exo-alpha-sialidase [Actinobacteria bacterium]|nr:MAG: exo-alpha-sialidase [Actinomycetota bacterium]